MTRDRNPDQDTFDRFAPPERGRFGDNEQAPPRGAKITGKSDIIDLTLALHAETERAVLVSEGAVEENAKWLPKSQVEVERTDKVVRRHNQAGGRKFPMVVVSLPQWLAKNKGLA